MIVSFVIKVKFCSWFGRLSVYQKGLYDIKASFAPVGNALIILAIAHTNFQSNADKAI